MRDLLNYPKINKSDYDEMICLIQTLLLPQNKATEKTFSTSLEHNTLQADEDSLKKLHQLSGKIISFERLFELYKKSNIEQTAMQLLQPKPPAVFDITLAETQKIITRMYMGNVSLAQFEYDKELLKSSLLLSELASYLPPYGDKTKEQADLENIAQKMYDEGKEGAAIIMV